MSSGICLLQRCTASGNPGATVGRIRVFQYPGDDRVRVDIEIWGHRPRGGRQRRPAFDLNDDNQHALHLHAMGDVFTANCGGACAHYMRTGQRHGLPHEHNCHSGDLGNIELDPEEDYINYLDKPNLTLQECVGRSFILHAGMDQGRLDPDDQTGGAGSRIAAGVVGWCGSTDPFHG